MNKVHSYHDVFNALKGNYGAFNKHYLALDWQACASGYKSFSDYLSVTNQWHTLTTQ